jgi:hypothetical protein
MRLENKMRTKSQAHALTTLDAIHYQFLAAISWYMSGIFFNLKFIFEIPYDIIRAYECSWIWQSGLDLREALHHRQTEMVPDVPWDNQRGD